MPFAQIVHNQNPRVRELEDRLTQEWQAPDTRTAEPVIIEEREREQAPSHLYVIWGEWGELSQNVRSGIVMNAYERVRGRNSALRVIAAMGLTPAEAQRMGIEYAPLAAPA